MSLTTSMGRALLTVSLSMLACGDDSDTAESSEGTAPPSTEDSTSGAATQASTTGTAATAATAMAEEETACVDDLPQLRVVNRTGNAIEEIEMLACDMSDLVSFPVPPDGLPDGSELTIALPAPGCWVVSYSGEGCFSDPPFMTEAAACETVTWETSLDEHVCAGG